MEEKIYLKNVKLIGGIGSILTLMGFIPGIGLVLLLIGLILILIAIKKISDVANKREIFRNYLISVVLSGIATILALVYFGIFMIQWVRVGFELEKMPSLGIKMYLPWFLSWIGGYFLMKSFREIARFSGEGLFKTAGVLIFTGSILEIILIGHLIEFLGNVLTAVAFFSLKEELPKKVDTQ